MRGDDALGNGDGTAAVVRHGALGIHWVTLVSPIALGVSIVWVERS